MHVNRCLCIELDWRETNGHVSDFGGKLLLEKLPPGEYQVILEAKRNKSPKVTSGAVLDNLMVVDCQKLGW